jgi:hypothetical protein
MHDQFNRGSVSIVDELANAQRADLASALRHDLESYNGPSICFGIMLAGAAYPVVVATILLAWVMVQIVASLNGASLLPRLSELAMAPIFLTGYAVLGALLGVVWAGVLSMITLPVVYLSVRSLKARGSLISLGALSGGLVGFIALLPLSLSVPWTVSANDYSRLFVLLPMGPGLATVLGQVGGAWGGWKATLHLANYYGIVATSDSERAGQAATEMIATTTDSASRAPLQPWQFGLRHVLWLVVWISVLLSVVRLSGIPFEFVIPLVAGWIVFQWITLHAGRRIALWIGPKLQMWRERRST